MLTRDQLFDCARLALDEADYIERDQGIPPAFREERSKSLRSQISAFVAGLRGHLPNGWGAYADMVLQKQDPEYPEYLRLKEKFAE